MVTESAPRHAWRIIAVLLMLSPLDQIGFDLYAPAMPLIGERFGVPNHEVQDTAALYMLGMTLVVFPAGLISDAFGRKRVLLSGLSILVVASVGCAAAHHMDILLAWRFVQGVGAGTCLLLAAAIAADCFRGAQLVSVLGMLGAAWGAAPVLAPAVGGLIVQFADWRWVFVVMAVLAGMIAVLVATVLPETLSADRRQPFDPRGTLAVLNNALRHPLFLGFTVAFGLVASAQAVFGVVAPFLYEEMLGFSAGEYGAVALVVGLANLLGALTCGWLAQRTTTRRLALATWVLFMIGALFLDLSARTVGNSAWAITAGAALAMLAIGVLDPLTKGQAMGVFTRNIGLITGLVTTCCYLLITAAMEVVALLPEGSVVPLSFAYLGAGGLFVVVLVATMTLAPRRAAPEPG